jgi:hypothetical protein
MKPVMIPSHAFSSTLHYPIDRVIRHHSLLCCVSASGDAYSPLLIAPDAKARIIFEKGSREHIDLKLEIRQIPYVDAELFNQYIKENSGAPDFCEIWERNYPIESLSAQRRNQKWGWVNQQFFRVKYVRQLTGGQTD